MTPREFVSIDQSLLFYCLESGRKKPLNPIKFICGINNYNPGKMVKKSQLRKYSLDKIMELVAAETNGENLKMYNDAIADRNAALLGKRNELLKELEVSRRGLEKIFYEMNVSLK